MLQQVISGLHISPGILGNNNSVAAFDLDWTLIRSLYGKFPKNADDWAFLPHRLSTLKAYADAGYTLVIFTNQGYQGVKLTSAIQRINNVIIALNANGLYPFVFAATGTSSYRKPGISMWQTFVQYMPNINVSTSIYVGDAAGRPEDHSTDDIDFARNIGLAFYVPEQIFPSG
jgi:bifunctional polynucleotide phosphatase/kinase